jgi:hypothetical protein
MPFLETGLDAFVRGHTACEFLKKVLEFDWSMMYLLPANMKTALRLIIPLVSTALAVGQLFAGSVIKDYSLVASPKNGNVSVIWQTVNETNVLRFEIWRAPVSLQTGAAQEFTFAGSMNPLGAGRQYEFIDQAPFKVTNNFFVYKVRVVFQDGTFADSDVVKTEALSSTAKRTWGSIKAMFR